jgi:phenylpropionate dioxygenase-like ring-hydroxylating dioxygenase large terminal subunit
MSDQRDPGVPNGWFAVAWSRDLVAGDVKPIYYFGKHLVLFRARSGEPKVLSAHCSHLGAHLGHGGRVVGESVRCPFHGWQYDGTTGACIEIPYCKRIPQKARVRAWEVVERNQMIFVWHHAEEKPPSWEVPVLSQLEDPNWSEPRHFDLEVPVHMQDMAENNLDPVHFQYVHGMSMTPETDISYGDDGRFLKAVSKSEQETPLGTFEMELIRDTWGLGVSSVETAGIPNVGLFMFTSTSPIDRENTITRWLLTATNNMVDIAGEEWFKGITSGVMADWDIWKNKVHRQEPVFCEADDLLVEFRRWARQFYTDPG